MRRAAEKRRRLPAGRALRSCALRQRRAPDCQGRHRLGRGQLPVFCFGRGRPRGRGLHAYRQELAGRVRPALSRRKEGMDPRTEAAGEGTPHAGRSREHGRRDAGAGVPC